MAKKKLTRQAMMKVDPNWLLILADSLRLVARRLNGGPLWRFVNARPVS